MPDAPLRIAQLMRSASRNNGGIFVAARGLSLELARHEGLRVEVFSVEDEHAVADRHEMGRDSRARFSRAAASGFQLRAKTR